MILIDIIVIFISLILVGFFAGAETGFISINHFRLSHLAEKDKKAKFVLDNLIPHIEKIISAMLIGLNIFVVVASVLTTKVISGFTTSEDSAAFFSVMILTPVITIFCNIIPKTIFRIKAIELTMGFSGLINFFFKLFNPFTVLLNTFSSLIKSVTGSGDASMDALSDKEDLKALIKMSENDGVIEEEERRMIHSVFDFNDTIVSEVMTPRTEMHVIDINEALSYSEVIDIFIQSGNSRIPIYEDDIDSIRGFIHVNDIAKNYTRGSFDLKSLIHSVRIIPETKAVSELLKEFKRTKNHIAIVVDEYGSVSGLVTIEDLLEEIIGEIEDEYDHQETELKLLPDGTYLVDGGFEISELNLQMNIQIEEENCETIGGFLSLISDSIPQPGEKLYYKDMLFTIIDADKKRVKSVKIKLMPRTGKK